MQLKLRDGTVVPRMRGAHNRRRMLVQARAELVQAGRALFEGADDRGLTADEKQRDDQTRAAIEFIDAELAFETQRRDSEQGLPVVLTPSGDGLGHGPKYRQDGTSEQQYVFHNYQDNLTVLEAEEREESCLVGGAFVSGKGLVIGGRKWGKWTGDTFEGCSFGLPQEQ